MNFSKRLLCYLLFYLSNPSIPLHCASDPKFSLSKEIELITKLPPDASVHFKVLNRDVQYLDGGSFGIAIEVNERLQFFLVVLSKKNQLAGKGRLLISTSENLANPEFVKDNSKLSAMLYNVLDRSKLPASSGVMKRALMIKGFLWVLRPANEVMSQSETKDIK